MGIQNLLTERIQPKVVYRGLTLTENKRDDVRERLSILKAGLDNIGDTTTPYIHICFRQINGFHSRDFIEVITGHWPDNSLYSSCH